MDLSIGTAAVLAAPPDAHVRLRGELDFATAPAMAAQFEEAVAFGCRDFRLDLSEVSFCDASTVRLLLRLERTLSEVGGTMGIEAPSPCVRRVFTIVGLGGVLDGGRSVDVELTPQ